MCLVFLVKLCIGLTITVTHGSCFCPRGSQAAVAHIVALEGSRIIIKFLKVHHLLHLEADQAQRLVLNMILVSKIHPLTRFPYALPSKVSCLLPMSVILEKMLRSRSS